MKIASDQLLTSSEVGELLQVNPSSVKKWVDDGLLIAFRTPGAHRMIDSGVRGTEAVREITRTSVLGIIVTGVMRVLLFLAIFGVVASGVALTSDNQAAEAFRHAAGEIGLRMFGIILWAAALTSVIGASYTSVSFITRTDGRQRTRNLLTVLFIAVCAVVYVFLGQAPQTLLIFAGAFNALILPIGFAVLLWVAWRRRDLLHGYRYPWWLLAIGVLAWLLTLFLAYVSIQPMIDLMTGG